MSMSVNRKRYLAMRKRRRRLISLLGGTLSLVLIFITVITSGTIISKRNHSAGSRGASEDILEMTADTESTETAELAEAATEMSEETVQTAETTTANTNHRTPGSSDYVFHEEAVDDGVFYAIQTPESVDLSSDENLHSGYAILVNADDWTIVAYKNPYTKAIPASMTKVATVLTASEHIDMSNLDATTTINREITDYAYENDLSVCGFELEEQIPIKDLFYGTILPSGADAAMGLANYAAGSQDAFVEMMNEELEKLDLSSTTHFTNCTGHYEEDHYSTAYDMAVIMYTAMQNDFLKTVMSTHTYTTTVTTEHPEGISLSNLFLRRIEDLEFGGTIQCAKTGYVEQSGNCAVSSEVAEDGTTYICVTMSAQGKWNCIYDHQYLYKTFGASSSSSEGAQ